MSNDDNPAIQLKIIDQLIEENDAFIESHLMKWQFYKNNRQYVEAYEIAQKLIK